MIVTVMRERERADNGSRDHNNVHAHCIEPHEGVNCEDRNDDVIVY